MEERDYMSCPLVVWVKTFRPVDSQSLKYQDLLDGVFLNDVMQEIDQRQQLYSNVHRTVQDVSVRILNWSILIRNIRGFYLDVLQQVLIWKLPSTYSICRDPEQENSFGEVTKVLLLILGCAVQCEHRQVIVDNIKQLDLHVQQAIVAHITEITDVSDAILVVDPMEDMEVYSGKMLRLITKLILERDEQQDIIHELKQEHDLCLSQRREANRTTPVVEIIDAEKHHMAVELADVKSKLRHSRHELEDKLETVTDLKDELLRQKCDISKLRIENKDLAQKVRAAQSLKDQVDVMEENAYKIDVYEKEIIHYKEQLNDLEFYKARTAELSEAVQILEETQTMLEEQLAASQCRAETVVELENEVLKLQQQIEQLTTDRDWDHAQIERLKEDICHLEFDKKSSINESACLEKELEATRTSFNDSHGSLSDQIAETLHTKILRLELENRRLSAKIKGYHEQSIFQPLNCNLNKGKDSDGCIELAASSQSVEIEMMQIDALKVKAPYQASSDMEAENQKLHGIVSSLRTVVKHKDELEHQNLSLSVEMQMMRCSLDDLKSSSKKISELEAEKDQLQDELQQVRRLLEAQKCQTARLEFDRLDKDNELQRLKKSAEKTISCFRQLEKEKIELEVENAKMQSFVHISKMTSQKFEDSERQRQDLEEQVEMASKERVKLEKEISRMRQNLDVKETLLEDVTSKMRVLELDHKSLQGYMEQAKNMTARVKELQKENKELIVEATSDKKALSALREELVKEKITGQRTQNEYEMVREELEQMSVASQKLVIAQQSKDESHLKSLQCLIEETLKKSVEIKDSKIQALETRLQLVERHNAGLQEELVVGKRTCRSNDDPRCTEPIFVMTNTDTVVHAPLVRLRAESSNVQSDLYCHSTNCAVDLKEHLVQLERTNATLLADNCNLHCNIATAVGQCEKLENQVSLSQCQLSHSQEQLSSLQALNAKMQVENTTLQSKFASLVGEKAEIQSQMCNMETEHDVLVKRHCEMTGKLQSIEQDHGTLQDLHRQLSLEYEAVVSEYDSLKSMHKSLRMELRTAQDHLESFIESHDDMNKVRDMMDKEQERLKLEQVSYKNLQVDHNRLKGDYDSISVAYDRLSKEYSDVLASRKALKTEINTLHLKTRDQYGELSEFKEQLTMAVFEVQKAENKLETMYQVNERLENENQALLLQLKQMLNQYHDLLTKALHSKDHFAEEEKQYLEKLLELRRQKERLEEKIMEHYKNRLSSHKKHKGIGAVIARKARNIISRAPGRSKSRPDLTTANHHSFQGSGFHSDSNVVHSDTVRRATKSSESLNRHAAVDEDVNGVVGLLQPKSLVPRSARTGQCSPGSEMLTLRQFLQEANQESESSVGKLSLAKQRTGDGLLNHDDTESRSSENSDLSAQQQRDVLSRIRAVALAHRRQQGVSDPSPVGLVGVDVGGYVSLPISVDTAPKPVDADFSCSSRSSFVAHSDATPLHKSNLSVLFTSTPKEECDGRYEDGGTGLQCTGIQCVGSLSPCQESSAAAQHRQFRVNSSVCLDRTGPALIGSHQRANTGDFSNGACLSSATHLPLIARNSRGMFTLSTSKATMSESLLTNEQTSNVNYGPVPGGAHNTEAGSCPPADSRRRVKCSRQPISRSRSVGPPAFSETDKGIVEMLQSGPLKDTVQCGQYTNRDAEPAVGSNSNRHCTKSTSAIHPHRGQRAASVMGNPSPFLYPSNSMDVVARCADSIISNTVADFTGAEKRGYDVIGDGKRIERPKSVPPEQFCRSADRTSDAGSKSSAEHSAAMVSKLDRKFYSMFDDSVNTGHSMSSDRNRDARGTQILGQRDSSQSRLLSGTEKRIRVKYRMLESDPNSLSCCSRTSKNPSSTIRYSTHEYASQNVSLITSPSGRDRVLDLRENGRHGEKNGSAVSYVQRSDAPCLPFRPVSYSSSASFSEYNSSVSCAKHRRTPTSVGYLSYCSGTSNSVQSALERLNPRAKPPGLQRFSSLSISHHQGSINRPATPMARIQPQTKSMAGPKLNSEQRISEGGDQQDNDRSKPNSMWYEYGCV